MFNKMYTRLGTNHRVYKNFRLKNTLKNAVIIMCLIALNLYLHKIVGP